MYFTASLYSPANKALLPSRLRTQVLAFLCLSTFLWLAVSFAIAWSFRMAVGYSDYPKLLDKTILLLCLWALVAFDCPLFLVALPSRVVKVADIEQAQTGDYEAVNTSKGKGTALSNSVFVLGFESRSEWKQVRATRATRRDEASEVCSERQSSRCLRELLLL
jgi:hypothetical protein